VLYPLPTVKESRIVVILLRHLQSVQLTEERTDKGPQVYEHSNVVSSTVLQQQSWNDCRSLYKRYVKPVCTCVCVCLCLCLDFHSFWTWEVFLISFVGIIAILVLVGIIIYFACVRKQHNEQLA